MHFVKSALEYRGIDEIDCIPPRLRGIYALYKKTRSSFDVVYVGMSGTNSSGSIKSRIKQHRKSVAKVWTHFSYYEILDEISDQEISEMEGIFRQVYRFDARANRHNVQVTHKPLIRLRKSTEKELGVRSINKKILGIP